MITINSIVDAIGAALNAGFGSECTVYAEEIKQGLSEPCFFISCINPTDRQFRGNSNRHYFSARYFRENRFCVQYLPSDENDGREESYDKAERLFSVLEEITADGDILRGTNMSFEYVDGVLSFFVSYNFFVYKTKEPSAMGEAERETILKE